MNLGTLLPAHARYRPNHPALTVSRSEYNFVQLNAEVNRLANALLEAGIRKGDKVVPGTAVAEIISEGYFTLLSEVEGEVKEFYVQEGEYVEIDTAIIEVELAPPEE